MSRSRFACLALVVILPYACAKSSDTETDDDATSGDPTTTGGGTGPGPGGNGQGGDPTGGQNPGGGNTGGDAAGGNGPGGSGQGGAPACAPVGECEICAADQCASQWNSCCQTTGCVDLSRCVRDNCDSDPFDLTCINASCSSELAAAGGVGGPGATAGISLGTCLQTALANPATAECTTCASQQ